MSSTLNRENYELGALITCFLIRLCVFPLDYNSLFPSECQMNYPLTTPTLYTYPGITSPYECNIRCDHNHDCAAYEFDTTTNECRLKGAEAMDAAGRDETEDTNIVGYK